MKQKNIYMIALLLLCGLVFSLTACAPDRHPYDPIEMETRRPGVSLILPAEGNVVSADTAVNVYFDEIMDISSVERAFSLDLVLSEDSLWTNISDIASFDIANETSGKAVLTRGEKGGFFAESDGNGWGFARSLSSLKISKISFDPYDSSTLYALTDTSLIKSIDSGENWVRIENGLPPELVMTSIDFDPVVSGTIWLGSEGQGVFKSFDAGENWSVTGNFPSMNATTSISRVRVDEADANTIYVSSLGRYVYKSIDGGASWEMKRGDAGSLGSVTRINDVVIDPNDNTHIYIATSNSGIYHSTDSADNWYQIANGLEDLETQGLVIPSANSNILYTYTTTAIYSSEDNGQNWSSLDLNLNDESLRKLVVSVDPSVLYAASNKNIYKSSDQGMSWLSINGINANSLNITGSYNYSKWQGEQIFYVTNDEATDTLTIMPYRYEEALARYEAGFASKPPLETAPKAHLLRFIPEDSFLDGWKYRVYVKGGFEGSDWRPEGGARDVHGMSIEFDQISHFQVSKIEE